MIKLAKMHQNFNRLYKFKLDLEQLGLKGKKSSEKILEKSFVLGTGLYNFEKNLNNMSREKKIKIQKDFKEGMERIQKVWKDLPWANCRKMMTVRNEWKNIVEGELRWKHLVNLEPGHAALHKFPTLFKSFGLVSKLLAKYIHFYNRIFEGEQNLISLKVFKMEKDNLASLREEELQEILAKHSHNDPQHFGHSNFNINYPKISKIFQKKITREFVKIQKLEKGDYLKLKQVGGRMGTHIVNFYRKIGYISTTSEQDERIREAIDQIGSENNKRDPSKLLEWKSMLREVIIQVCESGPNVNHNLKILKFLGVHIDHSLSHESILDLELAQVVPAYNLIEACIYDSYIKDNIQSEFTKKLKTNQKTILNKYKTNSKNRFSENEQRTFLMFLKMFVCRYLIPGEIEETFQIDNNDPKKLENTLISEFFANKSSVTLFKFYDEFKESMVKTESKLYAKVQQEMLQLKFKCKYILEIIKFLNKEKSK